MKSFLIPILLIISQFTAIQQENIEIGEIVIKVENIEQKKGDILIGIFDDPSVFLERGKFLIGKVFPVENEGTMEFRIPDIPHGTYAVAVYHDENSDTYLDKNMFGVPKEAYGFYKNVRAKWSAPTFEEASFELNTSTFEITITLKDWVDR